VSSALQGLIWALLFVSLEAVQFVYLGNLFQRVDSFAFGAWVFGLSTVGFVGFAWWFRRDQLRKALAQPMLLFWINLTAVLAWIAYLGSVQRIEPSVAYTIGSGVMPLATYGLWLLGVAGGERLRNRAEMVGNLFILIALIYLFAVTLLGHSGFVRGGTQGATEGLVLAVADGVFFVWLLILCKRLDILGIGAAVIFGLRMPLYVAVAGVGALTPMAMRSATSLVDWVWIILLGLMLIIPPLYALQRAVGLSSMLTISALTALGPFLIFALQMLEDRVDYSWPTLIGLGLYFFGALTAAFGAVRGARASD